MTHRALLALLLTLPLPALAGPSVERTLPELPAELAPDAELVVVSERPGAVHWGVDGWRLPPASLRPAGSRVVGNALETPLTGPARDGRYRAHLGPFGTRAASVQLVLHNADGSWTFEVWKAA